MAPLARHHAQRYPRQMRAHYDPEVDIALIVLEQVPLSARSTTGA